MRRLSTFLIAMVFLISACKDDDLIDATDFGYNYLPLEVGHWVEYEVDSIVLNPFTAQSDTYTFRMREIIVEVIDDLEGRPTYRSEQLMLGSDGEEIGYRRTTSNLIDGVRAEHLENNLRTVALVFPPGEGASWDGNAFNPIDASDFKYDYVDQAETIADNLYDSTLRVLQLVDTENLIFKSFSEERYARGVGLVFKEYFESETQFEIDSGLHWIQIAVSSSATE